MKTANAMQLKALIKKKSKELNVAPQLALQNYMLERLLERISRSEYSDKFIIKGGFFTVFYRRTVNARYHGSGYYY